MRLKMISVGVLAVQNDWHLYFFIMINSTSINHIFSLLQNGLTV